MTYQIEQSDGRWTLKDEQGNVITEGDLPLRTPEDVIEAILDDMGVGKPQKAALKVLFTQDWERSE